MRILLTNDDGIHAEGLRALEKALSRDHDISIVAPGLERSAVGHSITLTSPLRIDKVRTNGGLGFAVSGTPVDCVKLAVLEILENRPDIVISGINAGSNVGINLNYSGTVSAAKEAALMGIAAIAVSQDSFPEHDYDFAARFVGLLAGQVAHRGLPTGTFLNVNMPACAPGEIRGIRITRQGLSPLREIFHKRVDPRNRTYYWQGVETQVFNHEEESDGAALCGRWISITPVKCDMTDYGLLEELRKWPIPFSD